MKIYKDTHQEIEMTAATHEELIEQVIKHRHATMALLAFLGGVCVGGFIFAGIAAVGTEGRLQKECVQYIDDVGCAKLFAH